VYDSREIHIGSIPLGSEHPVRIQSMCTTNTLDTRSTADQCIRIFKAGASYVRLTVRNTREAENLRLIREDLIQMGFDQPLIADVHFNPSIACIAASLVEKVRINPGNFTDHTIRSELLPLLKICKEHQTILRIGVNHGSLSERILNEFGNSPEGMVHSAMEYLEICSEEGFQDIVISMKSSNTSVMINSNRLLVSELMKKGFNPAIHLGVTEAGDGEDGRIKSAIGIGTLLCEGIGDTIRVSLTEAPEKEIPVAGMIIKAAESNRSEHAGWSRRTDLPSQGKQAVTMLPDPDPVRPVLNIDPGRVPVVISNIPVQAGNQGDMNFNPQPDYLFLRTGHHGITYPYDTPLILPFRDWLSKDKMLSQAFPLYTLKEYLSDSRKSSILNFILPSPDEFNPTRLSALQPDNHQVIIVETDGSFSNLTYRQQYMKLLESGFRVPVILKYSLGIPEKEEFITKSAVDTGALFTDHICQGIWIENRYFDETVTAELCFNILQSGGRRIFRTEYIACPSCGRTLFDISSTLAGIRHETSHLKHLKIAVMGCIVNGPGEMADADYGYVGSARGKVTLFRGKDPVRKNIPEEDAISVLVELIRADGKWMER